MMLHTFVYFFKDRKKVCNLQYEPDHSILIWLIKLDGLYLKNINNILLKVF